MSDDVTADEEAAALAAVYRMVLDGKGAASAGGANDTEVDGETRRGGRFMKGGNGDHPRTGGSSKDRPESARKKTANHE